MAEKAEPTIRFAEFPSQYLVRHFQPRPQRNASQQAVCYTFQKNAFSLQQ